MGPKYGYFPKSAILGHPPVFPLYGVHLPPRDMVIEIDDPPGLHGMEDGDINSIRVRYLFKLYFIHVFFFFITVFYNSFMSL